MTFSAPDMRLSHLELYVRDVAHMEHFYTRCLGFVVTDRGEGAHGLVFLSRSPNEHHQIVLNPAAPNSAAPSRGAVDHTAFRVSTLAEVRACNAALAAEPSAAAETVSHGTTWSVYFQDPEGNRFEVFTDTPWHVDQPCKFEVDFTLDDEALFAATEQRIRDMPGFTSVATWRNTHAQALNRDQAGNEE